MDRRNCGHRMVGCVDGRGPARRWGPGAQAVILARGADLKDSPVETPPPSQPPASILVVAVLYRCDLSQSQSVSSLLQILNEDPDLATHFSLVFYDNSPQPQALTMA